MKQDRWLATWNSLNREYPTLSANMEWKTEGGGGGVNRAEVGRVPYPQCRWRHGHTQRDAIRSLRALDKQASIDRCRSHDNFIRVGSTGTRYVGGACAPFYTFERTSKKRLMYHTWPADMQTTRKNSKKDHHTTAEFVPSLTAPGQRTWGDKDEKMREYRGVTVQWQCARGKMWLILRTQQREVHRPMRGRASRTCKECHQRGR